jgi:hypothetical protein
MQAANQTQTPHLLQRVLTVGAEHRVVHVLVLDPVVGVVAEGVELLEQRLRVLLLVPLGRGRHPGHLQQLEVRVVVEVLRRV